MENMNDLPKIIIGLGNPGKEYDNTRHNIGFFYIDYLSQILKIKINLEIFWISKRRITLLFHPPLTQ